MDDEMTRRNKERKRFLNLNLKWKKRGVICCVVRWYGAMQCGVTGDLHIKLIPGGGAGHQPPQSLRLQKIRIIFWDPREMGWVLVRSGVIFWCACIILPVWSERPDFRTSGGWAYVDINAAWWKKIVMPGWWSKLSNWPKIPAVAYKQNKKSPAAW